MDSVSKPAELEGERAASGRFRFQPSRRAITHSAGDWKARPLRVETFGWKLVADAEPQALGLTYWFDPGTEGEEYPVTIRFAGRRVGVKGKPGRRDRFSVLESIDHVVPGSGPIAITTRVSDVAPGEWNVTASPVRDPRSRSGTRGSASPERLSLPDASSSGTTAFSRVIGIRAPGARLGAWPALVGLGVVIALVTQALLAAHARLPLTRVLLVSLLACLIGLAGAKLYYATGHYIKGDRGAFTLLSGTCIQGFVLGTVGALAVGARFASVPISTLLDVTAPGLLFGMTVGRCGCFFGGCCAGRPTASRWGLWSSDRRLGLRRVPTQLLESTVALVIGLAALIAAWTMPHPAGVVFIGAIAAYTFGRQLLFPLRAGPRHTSHGRTITMALAALVFAIDIAVAAFAK